MVAKASMQAENMRRRVEQAEEKSVPSNSPGWTAIYVAGAGNYQIPQDKYIMLREGFRNWSYTAITLIMDYITGLSSYLYKGKPSSRGDTSKPVEQSPYLEWFEHPNENMSRREFLEMTLLHYELTGEFFWHKERNARKQMLSLQILRPDLMRPVVNGMTLIGWKYATRDNGDGEFLPRKDVIHKLRPHPLNLLQGYSPVTAQVHTIQMDNDIRVHEQAFFKNGARPDYIINPEGDVNETQRLAIEEQIYEKHGGPAGQYKPMVIGGTKVNVTPLSMTNKDQQFKDLAQWVFENIFLSKGIPLGILSPQSSRAHAYQADKIFTKWCISPRLKILAEAETEAAREFDPQYLVQYENVIPQDAEFELEETNAFLDRKVYSINEVRAWKGLEPVPWGNEPYVPPTPVFGAQAALPAPRRKDAPAPEDEGYARRTKAWHAYIAKVTKKETLMRSAINKAFDWDRKEIKARITGSKGMVKSASDLFPSLAEWRKAWQKFLDGPASNVYGDFAQSGISGLGVDLNFNFDKPEIRAVFDKLLNKGIDELTKTSRDKLQEALADAIAEGQSAGDLASIVDDTIDGWKAGQSRAWTIARTETGKLSNAGEMAGWEQIEEDLGRKVMKEWIATRDELTRDAHAEMDGVIVESSEPFEVDGELMWFPLDPAGSAGNVVNCRCSMAAELAEE